MALLTVTINNYSTPMEKQAHEVERIQRYLQMVAQDVRSSGGRKTSGNIVDNGTGLVGSWTYTPQASS